MQETDKAARHLLCAAVVFCAVLVLYASSVSPNLLWDDEEWIGNNTFITKCSHLSVALNPVNLIKMVPVPMCSRPVVNASLIADTCARNGIAGMKLTNVIFHAFNAAAVFLLLLTLSGFEAGAFLGAMLFAVHPIAAETIHIITFRSHLLGFFFFSFGLSFATFFSRKPSATTATMAALCYFLALMSVETPLVLPLAIFSVAYFDSGREGVRKTLPLLAVMAAIALFYIWFRTPRSGYAIPEVSTPGIAGPSFLYPIGLLPQGIPGHKIGVIPLPWAEVYSSPLTNLFTMSRIFLEYLGTMLTALGLNSDYNPEVIKTFRQGIIPFTAAICVLAAGGYFLIKRNLAGLGLLLVVITLLPVLNIIPVYNIKASRYLYFPLAGLALASAGILQASLKHKGRKHAALGVAALWIFGLGTVTVRRNPEFRDNRAFFSGVVKRDPGIPRAQVNLSRAALLEGDCSGAVRHASLALELAPSSPILRLRLASNLAFCGRRGDALKEAEATLKQFPNDNYARTIVNSLRKGKPPAAAKRRRP